MAIILPALHSKNLKLTTGEHRFGTALLRFLEDDYFCWVDVPVGPKQRRPDFIVPHPGRGILVLEELHQSTNANGAVHAPFGYENLFEASPHSTA